MCYRNQSLNVRENKRYVPKQLHSKKLLDLNAQKMLACGAFFECTTEEPNSRLFYDNRYERWFPIYYPSNCPARLRTLPYIGKTVREKLGVEATEKVMDGLTMALEATASDFLISLRKVIVAASEEDLKPICDELGLDYAEVPEIVTFDLEDDDDCLGCKWDMANSIVINLTCIMKLVRTFELYPSMWMSRATQEVYITLFHELWHLKENNPFLTGTTEKESIDSKAEEAAAEAFGKQETARLFHMKKVPILPIKF